MDEMLTVKQWQEFQQDPVYKEVLAIVKQRIEYTRTELETGIEGGEILPYDCLRFLQGEAKGLRYLEVLMTNYERLLKDRDEQLLKKQEREEKDDKAR